MSRLMLCIWEVLGLFSILNPSDLTKFSVLFKCLEKNTKMLP
jgi:hypothetical protein